MEAGRELDLLIGQKVFGWKPGGIVINPLPYSTDILCAWEVVEKLRGKGFKVKIVASETYEKKSQCYCEIYLLEIRPSSFEGHQFIEDGKRVADEMSETAPHAICLAALKALEAK